MYEHESRAKSQYKNKLYSAMRKYQSYRVEVLEKCENFFQLKEREIFYVDLYKANGSGGYNMTNGGDGHSGYRVSDETRKRQSLAHTGRPLSDEHRAALNKANKARKGTKRSVDFCKKMSDLQKGKKKSTHAIDSLKKTVAKPFDVFNKTGEFIGRWNNVSDCAIDLNINRRSIHNFFSGMTASVGGYVFRRVQN